MSGARRDSADRECSGLTRSPQPLCLFTVHLPHPKPSILLSSKADPCSLHSDLSFDNSDLVMLKSLLAGLSLPSRDGRTDQGLDEEGEGKGTGGSPVECRLGS